MSAFSPIASFHRRGFSMPDFIPTQNRSALNFLQFFSPFLPPDVTMLDKNISAEKKMDSVKDWIANHPHHFVDITRIEMIPSSEEDIPLTKIPENAFFYFPNLEQLVLIGHALTTIPSTISLCPSLKLLDLRNNHLQNLPEAIGNLANLEVLDVENNQLSAFPQTLCHLHQLEHLHFANNQIHEISLQQIDFPSLIDVSYDGNPLNSVPDWIQQLPPPEEALDEPME